MEFSIHRLKMASTIKKGCHIALNMPLGVHILAAGLDIATESTMAEVAKCDTLGLTLFASYKYIKFLHLLIVRLCGCARGRGGARAGVPASVRENRPKTLPTGGFCRITH